MNHKRIFLLGIPTLMSCKRNNNNIYNRLNFFSPAGAFSLLQYARKHLLMCIFFLVAIQTAVARTHLQFLFIYFQIQQACCYKMGHKYLFSARHSHLDVFQEKLLLYVQSLKFLFSCWHLLITIVCPQIASSSRAHFSSSVPPRHLFLHLVGFQLQDEPQVLFFARHSHLNVLQEELLLYVQPIKFLFYCWHLLLALLCPQTTSSSSSRAPFSSSCNSGCCFKDSFAIAYALFLYLVGLQLQDEPQISFCLAFTL